MTTLDTFLAQYNYEQEQEKLGDIIMKHIIAMLKVGKQNAMSKDDILVNLEHHGLPFPLLEFEVIHALNRLFGSNVKTFDTPRLEKLYYLREADEHRDTGWY
jgi:hypothetical protein